MQERLQEIVFKNPTRTALILTTMILSSGHDSSLYLQCIRYLHQLAAAQIAKKKYTTLAPLLFPIVWFAIWNNEKMIFSLLNQLFGDYYLDRNPFSYYELFGLHPPHLIWRGTVYQDDCQPKQFFVDFAILHWPWLTIGHPGFKKKPHFNLQSTFLFFVDHLWPEDMQDDEKGTKKNF